MDAAGSCPEPPFFLEGGSSCSLQLRFSPLAKGLFEDAVGLVHDSDSGPDSVPIAGRGAPSAPLIGPDPLDFGNVDVGVISPPQSLTISNTSSVILELGAVDLQSGLEFGIDTNACGAQSLTPGAQCTVCLRFLPESAGAAQDLLRIDSDAVGAPGQAQVQGVGVDAGIFRDGFEQP